MPAQNFLSVIIPVYNGAPFLAATVESVLRQTYRPTEILLIDDGSTDDTPAIAERLQAESQGLLRRVYQANAGPSSARNHGLELAQGDFIAFLDADDLWPEKSLEVRTHALQADPALDVVTGQVRVLPETGEGTIYGPNLGAALFRRSVFDKVGVFDPTLRTSEDVDWFLRARENSVSIAQISAVTLHYRRHEASLTHQKSVADLQMLQVLRQSLLRRRALSGTQEQP
ncbi:MAG: glycosyltransferase family A protein [Armatimonadota bacterium]